MNNKKLSPIYTTVSLFLHLHYARLKLGPTSPERPTVYTDGACVGPSSCRRAGFGVYWGPNDKRNVSARLPGEQTNNRAELEAAIKAILQAKEFGIPAVEIATDSAFVQKCAIEWGPRWERNGWKLSTGKPVKLKEPVTRLLQAIRDSKVDVSWRHVAAHTGIPGNEAADRLANLGTQLPSP